MAPLRGWAQLHGIAIWISTFILKIVKIAAIIPLIDIRDKMSFFAH